MCVVEGVGGRQARTGVTVVLRTRGARERSRCNAARVANAEALQAVRTCATPRPSTPVAQHGVLRRVGCVAAPKLPLRALRRVRAASSDRRCTSCCAAGRLECNGKTSNCLPAAVQPRAAPRAAAAPREASILRSAALGGLRAALEVRRGVDVCNETGTAGCNPAASARQCGEGTAAEATWQKHARRSQSDPRLKRACPGLVPPDALHGHGGQPAAHPTRCSRA